MLSAEGSGKATQGAVLACVEGEGACFTEAGGSLHLLLSLPWDGLCLESLECPAQTSALRDAS